jgi:ABC-type multidrug transport system ATPase subunit
VILSTHIVEDVTDLCPRMAIINKGEVLLTGEPLEAIRSLDGRVWRKVVSKEELPAVQARLTVLSTRLVGGRPVVHALCDTQPEAGFDRVEPGLEDVYFGQLTRHRASLAA